jgi:copper chaperone CopZ
MSTPAEVLAAVKACLEQVPGVKLVRRGVPEIATIRPLPALCYYREALQTEQGAGGISECTLKLGVYGVAEVPAASDFSGLDALEDAVVAALLDPQRNPYWAYTTVGETGYLEFALLGHKLAAFDLAVSIEFETAR